MMLNGVMQMVLPTWVKLTIIFLLYTAHATRSSKAAGSPGFDSWWLPWVYYFFSSSWLTNVDRMKDLWCSSTAWLLSAQIWMVRRICSVLVQFGWYQRRHKLYCVKAPSIFRQSLELSWQVGKEWESTLLLSGIWIPYLWLSRRSP